MPRAALNPSIPHGFPIFFQPWIVPTSPNRVLGTVPAPAVVAVADLSPADGLLDLIISHMDSPFAPRGKLRALRNTGSEWAPAFTSTSQPLLENQITQPPLTGFNVINVFNEVTAPLVTVTQCSFLRCL